MVKQIIKESIEKNPIGLKEAVEAELMERLRLALESKKKGYEDEYEELDESASVEDFMKLFKLKDEPEEGTRMNLAGYPFDFDGYEDGAVELTAVDSDAAKGLARELKKRKFDVERYGKQTVNVIFE